MGGIKPNIKFCQHSATGRLQIELASVHYGTFAPTWIRAVPESTSLESSKLLISDVTDGGRGANAPLGSSDVGPFLKMDPPNSAFFATEPIL